MYISVSTAGTCSSCLGLNANDKSLHVPWHCSSKEIVLGHPCFFSQSCHKSVQNASYHHSFSLLVLFALKFSSFILPLISINLTSGILPTLVIVVATAVISDKYAILYTFFISIHGSFLIMCNAFSGVVS